MAEIYFNDVAAKRICPLLKEKCKASACMWWQGTMDKLRGFCAVFSLSGEVETLRCGINDVSDNVGCVSDMLADLSNAIGDVCAECSKIAYSIDEWINGKGAENG